MKRILLMILALSMTFTTGCWDMIELEDRILPYSVALDSSRGHYDKEEDEKKLFVCFSYPNINALGKSPTQEELVYIVNADANSIFEATKEISSRIYNPIFLKHLNVLILSEEIAANEKLVREIFDGIQRDFIINKMINLVITKESAHEILLKKLGSKRQETVEGLFVSILRNEQKSSKFTPKKLMEFIQDMDHQKVAVVPLATSEQEIEIAGGGLFKDYKFIGYIDEIENKNITVLNNDIKTGDLDIDYKGVNLSLSLSGIKSKKKLIKDQKVLKIGYNVEMNCQIHQYIIDEDRRIDSQEIVEDMERHVEDYVASQLNSTIDKLQSEFNADAIGILEYLYKFHPKIYKEVEGDWDGIFPYIEIEVKVKANIRRRGLSDY